MRYRQSPLTNVLLGILGFVLIMGSVLTVLWLGHRANREVKAVVAIQTVLPLHAIEPGDLALRVVPLPVAAREGGFATSPAAFVGRVAAFGLPRGAVLHPGDLLAAAAGTAMDAQLQELSRDTGTALVAVPLPLDQEEGFDLPAPGDRVTLFATVSGLAQGSGGPADAAEAPVALRARVLAVQSQGGGGGAPTIGFAGGGSGVQVQARITSGVLILALTPPQAERVILAEHLGQLTLVLDPPQCRGGQRALCARSVPGVVSGAALLAPTDAQAPRTLPAVAGQLPVVTPAAAVPADASAAPPVSASAAAPSGAIAGPSSGHGPRSGAAVWKAQRVGG